MRRHAPARCVVYGRTAVYARMLAAKAAARLASVTVGSSLIAIGVVLLHRSDSPLSTPALVVAVPTVFAGWVAGSRASSDWARARAGVAAEEAVARSLVRSGAVCVVNGVLLGRGDIDHVVLGPWLVAVETKFGRGELRLDDRGRILVGGRLLPRDPIGQARTNARMLSRHLGRDVSALVVVSEGSGPAIVTGGVVVSPRSGLGAVLRNFPEVLAADLAAALGEHLPTADR